MHIPQTAFVLTLAFSAAMAGAQAPALPGQAASNPAPAPAPAVKPSLVLRPALDEARSTLLSLKIDKWKRGSVRDEAGNNVNALLQDLQINIPPLLTAADAEPGALSRTMPLMKHLDAFYDVLLRVEEASRVSAPSDQISELQRTLLDVNRARIALDDQMTAEAVSREKQIFDLQNALRQEKETAAAAREREVAKAKAEAAAACKPATPTHRRHRTTHTTNKTTQPATKSTAPASSTPKPQ